MKRILFTLFIITGITHGTLAQTDISGYWKTEEGSSVIQIKALGDNMAQGTIAWFDTSKAPKGEIPRDRKNPDKKLRNRELKGLAMLEKLEWKEQAWRGSIYSPKNGRTAKVAIKLKSDDELEVKVRYRGLRKTQVWTRTAIVE